MLGAFGFFGALAPDIRAVSRALRQRQQLSRPCLRNKASVDHLPGNRAATRAAVPQWPECLRDLRGLRRVPSGGYIRAGSRVYEGSPSEADGLWPNTALSDHLPGGRQGGSPRASARCSALSVQCSAQCREHATGRGFAMQQDAAAASSGVPCQIRRR